MWLTHRSGHSCVVSTAVLEAVGITAGLPPGGRGRVELGPDGRPTGLIEEAAMDLVKDHVGPSSLERTAQAIDRATAHYLTEGITGFTDAGIGSPGIDHTPVELAAYQLARRTGRLHTRAQVMVFNGLFHAVASHPDDGILSGLDLGIHTGFGDDWLSLGAMKIWIDGSGLGHTAATTGPDGTVRGAFDDDPAVLTRSIVDAHRAGWQVAAHAIGDAAVDLVLDALEEAAAGGPVPARGGVPRGTGSNTGSCPARSGRTAGPDGHHRGNPAAVHRRLRRSPAPGIRGKAGGRGLLPHAQPARRRCPLGRELRPARVSGVAAPGYPSDGGAHHGGRCRLRRRRTVDAHEALASYTAGGARAAHGEDHWGTLAPRRLADLVVLGDDPTSVAVDRIGSIQVLATVVGGRAAHDPGALLGDAADG